MRYVCQVYGMYRAKDIITRQDQTKYRNFPSMHFPLIFTKGIHLHTLHHEGKMTAAAIPLPPGTAQNHQAKQTHDTASCHAATIALAEYSPARTSITTRTLRHISRKIRKQKEPDDRLRRLICDERPCISAEHLRPRPSLRYT